jgi:hypothetical protein
MSFWSAVGSVLAVVMTSAHLYDRLHRGLPGVVRMRAINAGSGVNAAYLASMASGRKWGHFDDRTAGDPLRTPHVVPPRGRADGPRRPQLPGLAARPRRAVGALGRLCPQVAPSAVLARA